MTRPLSLMIAGLCLLSQPLFAFAQKSEDKPAKKEAVTQKTVEKKKETVKKTHTVKKSPFKQEVTLDGVFEAESFHEISIVPDEWSTLKVERVVAEGTAVKEGETILWLDTKKIDESIRETEFSFELGALSLMQAEVELETLEKSVPLDLEAARRMHRIAHEDLAYYREVTEGQRKKAAEESLKSAEYSLEYSQEELDQLEQMYKADDLTEQTEEIILKRAQRTVERGEYYLDLARVRNTRSLKTTLPREKQQIEESAIRADLTLRKVEAILPSSLEKKRIEREKLRHTQDKLEKKLGLLREDRERLTIKAPADGIVHYGQADRGKWASALLLRKSLRPGGSLTANKVVLTLVVNGPGFVRVDVPEKEYRHFTENTPAVINPTAFPNTTFTGECGPLGPVAVKAGVFDGRVFYSRAQGSPQPSVGMTCKVTITPYTNDNAITVPASAVLGKVGDKHVFLDDGGKSKKQTVEVGETSGKKTEITGGLSEGDVILLEKP